MAKIRGDEFHVPYGEHTLALTARGKALRRMSTHRGITEEPHGSNTDKRPHKGDKRWGIRKAQQALGAWLVGLPWCGTWCAWALSAAGVKGVSYRQASVAFIEDDARAHREPFWDWQPPGEWQRVLRGDLAVMFGRGVHVEMVRSFKRSGGRVYVVTDGGNTSSGMVGPQSNGGGSFRRVRPLSDVYGFARVDYPGGAVRARVSRALMALEARRAAVEPEPTRRAIGVPVSDRILAAQMGPDAPAGLGDEILRALG
jgi:hypothetical protein